MKFQKENRHYFTEGVFVFLLLFFLFGFSHPSYSRSETKPLKEVASAAFAKVQHLRVSIPNFLTFVPKGNPLPSFDLTSPVNCMETKLINAKTNCLLNTGIRLRSLSYQEQIQKFYYTFFSIKDEAYPAVS